MLENPCYGNERWKVGDAVQATGISPNLVRVLASTAPDLLAEMFVAGKVLEAEVLSVFQGRAMLSFGKGVRLEVVLQAMLKEGQKVRLQVQPREQGSGLALKLVQPQQAEQGAPARPEAPPAQAPPTGSGNPAPGQAPAAQVQPQPLRAQASPAPAPGQPLPAQPGGQSQVQPQPPGPAAGQPGPAQGQPVAQAAPPTPGLPGPPPGGQGAVPVPAGAAQAGQPAQATQAPTGQAPATPAPAGSPAQAAQPQATQAQAGGQPQAAPAPTQGAQPQGQPMQGQTQPPPTQTQAPTMQAQPAATQTPVPTAQAPQAQPLAQSQPQPSQPPAAAAPGPTVPRPEAAQPAPEGPLPPGEPAAQARGAAAGPEASAARQEAAQAQPRPDAPQPLTQPPVAHLRGEAGQPPLMWIPIPLENGKQGWAQLQIQEGDARGQREGGPQHQVRLWWETPTLGQVQVTMDASGSSLTTLFTILLASVRAGVERGLTDLQTRLSAAGFEDVQVGCRQALPGENVGPVVPDGDAPRLDRRM